MCYQVISEVKMTKESLLETADDYMSINIQVDGFWTDTVSATLRLRGQRWEIDQRHSSGGSEKGDKLQQEINMATAMIDLATFLKETFTAEFQRELTDAVEAKIAKYKAEREAKSLERKSKLDEQDPAIGEATAKLIVNAVKTNAKLEGSSWIKCVSRVVDDEEASVEWYRAECGSNGAVRFRYYSKMPFTCKRSYTEACTAADVVGFLINASRANTRIVSEAERQEINQQGLAA